MEALHAANLKWNVPQAHHNFRHFRSLKAPIAVRVRSQGGGYQVSEERFCVVGSGL